MKLRIHPLPYATDIAFAIRDDDVSYFTPTEKLEKIYRNARDKGFKVSFATVPMHKGTNTLNVPPEFRNSSKYYPINQNEELVEYLKTKISKGKVDILQHGFCHTENSNLPALKFDLEKGNLSTYDGQKVDLAKYSEFYGANEKEVSYKIKEGKRVLEETFGVPIKVFVSPQELLTKPLWTALWKNNLDYCGGIGRNIITQAPIRHINLYPLLKTATKKVLRIDPESIGEDMMHITDIITIPATYRHYWNKFTSAELAEYWFNQFKTIFEKKKRQNGYFILLTHYFEYFYDWEDGITQKRQYEYLYKVLKYVNENSNAWKCTVSELVDWIMAKKTIVVRKKHNKLKISSAIDMSGLTIASKGINTKELDKEVIEIKEKGDKEFLILDIKAGECIDLPMKKSKRSTSNEY